VDAANRRRLFPSFALEPLKRRIIGAEGESRARDCTPRMCKFAVTSRLLAARLEALSFLAGSESKHSINRDEHGRGEVNVQMRKLSAPSTRCKGRLEPEAE